MPENIRIKDATILITMNVWLAAGLLATGTDAIMCWLAAFIYMFWLGKRIITGQAEGEE